MDTIHGTGRSETAASPGVQSSPERSPAATAMHARRYLHAIALLPLTILLSTGCGAADAEPDSTAGSPAPAEAAATPAPSDPCSLVPVAEWVELTGYTDIETDRSAGNTCDYLSDDMFGVVGSVILPGRALMENPPAIAGETDPIADLGDEAFWMSMGPIVRVGDTVIWITVNPKVENQREVGIALARIAIDRI